MCLIVLFALWLTLVTMTVLLLYACGKDSAVPSDNKPVVQGAPCSNCGYPLVKVGFLNETDNSEVIVCVNCDKVHQWPYVNGDIRE